MENDLISRSALLDKEQWFADEFDCNFFPFIDPKDVEDAPAVDAVPVERLGKIGKLFIPYSGCPRGPVGRMGEPATLAEEAMFWGVIVDEDGTRFVPVVEEVLHELIEKASAVDAVEVVRCKDCKRFPSDLGVTYCDYHTAHACDDDGYCDGVCGVYEDDFCSYGERRADDGK